MHSNWTNRKGEKGNNPQDGVGNRKSLQLAMEQERVMLKGDNWLWNWSEKQNWNPGEDGQRFGCDPCRPNNGVSIQGRNAQGLLLAKATYMQGECKRSITQI